MCGSPISQSSSASVGAQAWEKPDESRSAATSITLGGRGGVRVGRDFRAEVVEEKSISWGEGGGVEGLRREES